MLQRLWPALERIPGQQAVLAEWGIHLGEGFDSLQSLLIPTDRYAESIPVAGDPYSFYRVVRHAPDDIVGVHDSGRPPLKLSKRDVLIYRLDHQRIIRLLTTALGIELNSTTIDGVSHTYRVGAFRPFAGFSFPAFFTIPVESNDLQQVAEAIVARHHVPFILLAPTSRCLRPSCEHLLRARGACFLALMESIAVDGAGKFLATQMAQRRLAEFQQAAVPNSDDAVGMAFFPTPTGAAWKDVRIKFVDGETVSIKVGGATGTFVYAQLGMADNRNAKPTLQWELLIAFARGYGALTWSSAEANRKNQKRREMLAANLRKFFRIDGDPIEYVGETKGWRTLFTVEPDA
jgi:hypothetical protein